MQNNANQSINHVSCADCAFLKPCGGHDRPGLFGCSIECNSCDRKYCDVTCTQRMPQLIQRMQEVGGFERTTCSSKLMVPSTDLPVYIPVIRNSSSRKLPLEIPFAALLFQRVIKLNKDGKCVTRKNSDIEIKKDFLLSPKTKVIISSVAFDRYIETYWRLAEHDRIDRMIAMLSIEGMTVPNFSYFTNVPRTHILYNRRRGLITAERMSDGGIGVIPHLNALTTGDWQFWTSFLKSQPAIKYIAMEFQTGLRSHIAGERAIQNLEVLQEMTGRHLHPILVGGAQFVSYASKRFNKITIVDSRPFINTVKRQKFHLSREGIHKWESSPTAPDETLDVLMAKNIAMYSAWIEARASGEIEDSYISSSNGQESVFKPIDFKFRFTKNLSMFKDLHAI